MNHSTSPAGGGSASSGELALFATLIPLGVVGLAVVLVFSLRCCLVRPKKRALTTEMVDEQKELGKQRDLYKKEVRRQVADIRLYRETIASLDLENQQAVSYIEDKKKELEARMPGLFKSRSRNAGDEGLLKMTEQLSALRDRCPEATDEMTASEIEAVRIERKKIHEDFAMNVMEAVCVALQERTQQAGVYRAKFERLRLPPF